MKHLENAHLLQVHALACFKEKETNHARDDCYRSDSDWRGCCRRTKQERSHQRNGGRREWCFRAGGDGYHYEYWHRPVVVGDNFGYGRVLSLIARSSYLPHHSGDTELQEGSGRKYKG